MATLLLSTVGSAAGSALGGPIGGAVGRVLGAAAGALVDRALVGGDSPRFVEGPRLTELDGLASSEGAAIPRVYGRARIGGQLIWATRFEEVATTAVERSGGRGGKSVGGSGKTVPPPMPISPTSRSACARARSASCGGCGRMGASST